MTYNRSHAARLTTASEQALFESSLPPALRALSPRELARAIERARKLRDKHRDLVRRQGLRSRQRGGTPPGSPSGNRRTEQKAKLFAEALERFRQRESRLQELERERPGSTGLRPERGPRRRPRAAGKDPGRIERRRTRSELRSVARGGLHGRAP